MQATFASKIKKIVTIYTNDPTKTPLLGVTGGDQKSTLDCTYGTVFIQRWLGRKVHDCTYIPCPAPFAAYNIFMNGVDKFDQLHSTNPTRHKEIRLPMSIFTACLDWGYSNSYMLYKDYTLKECLGPVKYVEFK